VRLVQVLFDCLLPVRPHRTCGNSSRCGVLYKVVADALASLPKAREMPSSEGQLGVSLPATSLFSMPECHSTTQVYDDWWL